MCKCICVETERHTHSHHCMEKQVKRQLSIVGVLLLCVFYRLDACLQAWQQTYLFACISFLVTISKNYYLWYLVISYMYVIHSACSLPSTLFFHPFHGYQPFSSPMSPFQRCLIFSWAHSSLFLIIIGSHGQPPFTGKRSFSY